MEAALAWSAAVLLLYAGAGCAFKWIRLFGKGHRQNPEQAGKLCVPCSCRQDDDSPTYSTNPCNSMGLLLLVLRPAYLYGQVNYWMQSASPHCSATASYFMRFWGEGCLGRSSRVCSTALACHTIALHQIPCNTHLSVPCRHIQGDDRVSEDRRGHRPQVSSQGAPERDADCQHAEAPQCGGCLPRQAHPHLHSLRQMALHTPGQHTHLSMLSPVQVHTHAVLADRVRPVKAGLHSRVSAGSTASSEGFAWPEGRARSGGEGAMSPGEVSAGSSEAALSYNKVPSSVLGVRPW